MQQFFQDNTDKRSTRVPKTLRLAIWDMYAGTNKCIIKCMMCRGVEMNRIKSKQWEAGHIVAEKFHLKKPCRYDLIPICPGCNNQCSDICIFDFLWGIERYKSLEHIIRAITNAFIEQNPDQFEDDFNSETWRILKHFYAGDSFRAGGGLMNEKQIYTLAKQLQIQDEMLKISKYSKKIKRSNEIVQKCSKRIKLNKK